MTYRLSVVRSFVIFQIFASYSAKIATCLPQFGSKMTAGKIGQLTLLILATVGVVHAVTFPLDPPELSEKCLCAEQDDAGWSSQQNRCLSSSVTSCLECPTRQICAGITDLAGALHLLMVPTCCTSLDGSPDLLSNLHWMIGISRYKCSEVVYLLSLRELQRGASCPARSADYQHVMVQYSLA